MHFRQHTSLCIALIAVWSTLCRLLVLRDHQRQPQAAESVQDEQETQEEDASEAAARLWPQLKSMHREKKIKIIKKHLSFFSVWPAIHSSETVCVLSLHRFLSCFKLVQCLLGLWIIFIICLCGKGFHSWAHGIELKRHKMCRVQSTVGSLLPLKIEGI